MRSRLIVGIVLLLGGFVICGVGLQLLRYLEGVQSYCDEVHSNLGNKTLTVHLHDEDLRLKYTDYVAVEFVDTGDVEWIFYTNDAGITHNVIVDTEKLIHYLMEIQNTPVDAQLVYSAEEGYYIVPEQDYMCFPYGNVVMAVIEAFKHEEDEVDCSQWYLEAKVKEKDLLPSLHNVEWTNGYKISFTSGNAITQETLYPYVTKNYELDTDNVLLSELLDNLIKFYTTQGNTSVFVTSGGEIIDVVYKTYGKYVDVKATEEMIRDLLNKHESAVDLEPDIHGYDSGLSTYIEVSIKDQHVWHYVDGELCCESDCVTGTKDSRDTPTGVYYVSERIPGKYLIGDDYKTWVNKWMRLTNSGVGLHDAYWRDSFGGSIYTYDGSHGCINLPPKYAASLFGEIRVGIPTVIY